MMPPSGHDDRDLLFKIIESLAETKAMLKAALDRQGKADEEIKAIEGRVSALELREARQSGRAGVIGTVSGTVAAGGVTVLTMYIRDKLGL